jgi:hypothetical protein
MSTSKPKILLGGLALLAVAGLAAACKGPSTEAQRNQQLHQGRIHFALRGALLLRDRTHNPGLKFSRVEVMGDDGPICYSFRVPGAAQDESAVLNDDKLLVSDESAFAPLWQEDCAQKPGEDVTADVVLGLAQHDKTPSQ